MAERYSSDELFRMLDQLRDEAIHTWTVDMPGKITENNMDWVDTMANVIQAKVALAQLVQSTATAQRRREQMAAEAQRDMAKYSGPPRPTP